MLPPHLHPRAKKVRARDRIIHFEHRVKICVATEIKTRQSYTMTAPEQDTQVPTLRKILTSESEPLARRFRALFSLKHLASVQPPNAQSVPAIEAIAAALGSPSALLKHELAYCLGQSGHDAAIAPLRGVLEDKAEDSMCRHEAAEALGALSDKGSLELLRQLRDDIKEEDVVRETCDIAVDRIEWEHGLQKGTEKLKKRCVCVLSIGEQPNTICSDFTSIDPAPPMPQGAESASIPDLEKTLLDTSLPLFQRYRAMFALRDLSSPPDLPTAVPAVHALARGFSDPSALFRHEIAFVFGQLSHPASIPSLTEALSNTKEASMVRHEAAEALGSLGDEAGVEDTLKSFLNDPEQVVRDSVIVALDMAAFEKNGEVEYAIVPQAQAIVA
jgi:deoxyhypusine monooxygenase